MKVIFRAYIHDSDGRYEAGETYTVTKAKALKYARWADPIRMRLKKVAVAVSLQEAIDNKIWLNPPVAEVAPDIGVGP